MSRHVGDLVHQQRHQLGDLTLRNAESLRSSVLRPLNTEQLRPLVSWSRFGRHRRSGLFNIRARVCSSLGPQ